MDAYNDNDERTEITFVFVTPRRWPAKDAWIKEKTALNLWKEVRVYDASDLEQWLDQSLPGQAWFANETKKTYQFAHSISAGMTGQMSANHQLAPHSLALQ
ncbi:hypothetical protein [Methylomonas sp. CM2]|uniref:hypothetical protein n=1 Tax=Methylomonas sp. CM2 TaxID=3417647 RepID=UPI003CF98357